MEFKVNLVLQGDDLIATLQVDNVVVSKVFKDIEDYHVIHQELLTSLFESDIKAEQLAVLRKQIKVTDLISRDIKGTLWELQGGDPDGET